MRRTTMPMKPWGEYSREELIEILERIIPNPKSCIRHGRARNWPQSCYVTVQSLSR
jgi:hypothetical protein